MVLRKNFRGKIPGEKMARKKWSREKMVAEKMAGGKKARRMKRNDHFTPDCFLS